MLGGAHGGKNKCIISDCKSCCAYAYIHVPTCRYAYMPTTSSTLHVPTCRYLEWIFDGEGELPLSRGNYPSARGSTKPRKIDIFGFSDMIITVNLYAKLHACGRNVFAMRTDPSQALKKAHRFFIVFDRFFL
jgi:hypothetical protein